jgi:hypothetical protein
MPRNSQGEMFLRSCLAEPGESLHRFALEDWLNEGGRFGEGLRNPGKWLIEYRGNHSRWALLWLYKILGQYGERWIATLSRVELPRCVTCGARAYWSFAPTWHWVCDRDSCLHSAKLEPKEENPS